ncbi:hypothetical protein RF11_05552 [Thelohanellus kitauei]|uniref:Uncharacterized protein n=1 Tax=Thelohanellus kitauei TaxID=669202 RepID=A0A0C2JXL1_THEKT|nr:hypothetical protein RF11_05552 [Thelohanellus kitauei]
MQTLINLDQTRYISIICYSILHIRTKSNDCDIFDGYIIIDVGYNTFYGYFRIVAFVLWIKFSFNLPPSFAKHDINITPRRKRRDTSGLLVQRSLSRTDSVSVEGRNEFDPLVMLTKGSSALFLRSPIIHVRSSLYVPQLYGVFIVVKILFLYKFTLSVRGAIQNGLRFYHQTSNASIGDPLRGKSIAVVDMAVYGVPEEVFFTSQICLPETGSLTCHFPSELFFGLDCDSAELPRLPLSYSCFCCMSTTRGYTAAVDLCLKGSKDQCEHPRASKESKRVSKYPEGLRALQIRSGTCGLFCLTTASGLFTLVALRLGALEEPTSRGWAITGM